MTATRTRLQESVCSSFSIFLGEAEQDVSADTINFFKKIEK